MLRKSGVPILTVTRSGREGRITFEKILAATDLSPTAQSGLDIAAALARAFGSQLTIVHVLDRETEAVADPRRGASKSPEECSRRLRGLRRWPALSGSEACRRPKNAGHLRNPRNLRLNNLQDFDVAVADPRQLIPAGIHGLKADRKILAGTPHEAPNGSIAAKVS